MLPVTAKQFQEKLRKPSHPFRRRVWLTVRMTSRKESMNGSS